MWELLVIKLRLRISGFREAVRYATAIAASAQLTPEIESSVVSATTRRMAAAAAFFPGRARCLEQSLALCHLLAARGVPVVFRIGVQPYRFRAHAWIEYDGKPVWEPGDGVTGYVPLPNLPV
jgi:hypothetical protein